MNSYQRPLLPYERRPDYERPVSPINPNWWMTGYLPKPRPEGFDPWGLDPQTTEKEYRPPGCAADFRPLSSVSDAQPGPSEPLRPLMPLSKVRRGAARSAPTTKLRTPAPPRPRTLLEAVQRHSTLTLEEGARLAGVSVFDLRRAMREGRICQTCVPGEPD